MVIDNIHIGALLIGQKPGPRHGDDLPCLDGFEQNGDEPASREFAKRSAGQHHPWPQDGFGMIPRKRSVSVPAGEPVSLTSQRRPSARTGRDMQTRDGLGSKKPRTSDPG
jgi:hypothetical protein